MSVASLSTAPTTRSQFVPGTPIVRSSDACRCRPASSDLDDVTVRVGDIRVGNARSMLSLVDQGAGVLHYQGDRIIQSAAVLDGDPEVLTAPLLANPGPFFLGLGEM